MKRGFTLAKWCYMCRQSGETMKHFLLHMILEFCLLYVGIHWVMPRSVVDLLFSWRNWFGKHSFFIYNLTPMLVMDTGERNCHPFEDMEALVVQLKTSFIRKLIEWSFALGLVSFQSVVDFVDSLFSIGIPFSL